MALDEQELLVAAQRNDPAALQEFVERHKKYVYYLALNLTGNHHDAEDLSQEVFMKAFVSIQGFRGDAKMTSWLHRITVNAYLDQKNKASFKLLKLGDRFEEDADIELPATHPSADPEKQFQQKSIASAIEKALNKLSPRERTVFILRHYREQQLKEIAETLGIAEGTVKSCLFHAVHRLQKALGGYRFREELL